MSIEQTIQLALKQWSNLSFKIKNSNEAESANCPFCGQGEDRFLVFADSKRYWCRHCKTNGSLLDTAEDRLSQVEIELLKQKAEIARIKREQENHKTRIEALEKIAKCQAHITYHAAITERARAYWHSQGINDHSIDRWCLGFCQHIPLWSSRSSYTIPVINNGQLRNIRHRATDNKKPKYLPHIKGLPNTIFNADRLIKPANDILLIVEGEKKVIVSEQNTNIATIGVLGTHGFKNEWLKWFKPFRLVYVAYDPDAIDKGAELAKKFGLRGRVCEFDEKPDDYFVNGGTMNGFLDYLKKARLP